jgi:hypothetical protein
MAWKMIELNDGPIVWFYKKTVCERETMAYFVK